MSPQNERAGRTFFRLLALAKPYLLIYALMTVIILLLSFTGVAIAELLRRTVNAAADKNMSLLVHSFMLAIGVAIADTLGNFVRSYLAALLENKSTLALQSSLLRKIMRIQSIRLDGYHSSDIINRMNDSAVIAQTGINARLLELTANICQIAFMLTYLISLNFKLTLGMLLISMLAPLLAQPFIRPMRRNYEHRQKAVAAQEAFIQDNVQGAEVVRSLSLAQSMDEQFRQLYAKVMQGHMRVFRLEMVINRLPLVIVFGGLLYVLGYGGYMVIQGQLDVGAVVAFFIAFERVMNPLSQLGAIWARLQEAIAHGKRVFEVMDLQEEEQLGEQRVILNEADIVFDRVRFGYNPERIVLHDISFTIRCGGMTALTGPSGSGKSTLLALLLRLHEPDAGDLKAGAIPLPRIPLERWRQGIAYVSQEPVLFSGTLYENIAYGRPSASADEVEQAARAANIHSFIMSTPDHYRTRIGEKGILLSGGERQRVSIARAMLKNPRLLLLDEPTSALDGANEQLVQQALETVMSGRTTVIVAHRLSTIRHADHIVYMENGRIMEEGTYDELLLLKGKFHAMSMAAVSRHSSFAESEENLS